MFTTCPHLLHVASKKKNVKKILWSLKDRIIILSLIPGFINVSSNVLTLWLDWLGHLSTL